MRHREGEVLVGGEHRLRHRRTGPRGFRERLDERREIGPGIGEQILDPAFGEEREIGFRDIVDREFFPSHRITSSKKHRLPQFCALRSGRANPELAIEVQRRCGPQGPCAGWKSSAA